MRARWRGLLVAAALMLAGGGALAQSASPVGLWRTIDDATGKPKAVVRISESNGVLSGRIEQVLDPTAKPDAVCDQCTDERKDQPIKGLTIIRGLKPSGDHWAGGDILDPNNGKVYRARIHLAEGGRKLEVRGFIGFALLGRTQVWERAE